MTFLPLPKRPLLAWWMNLKKNIHSGILKRCPVWANTFIFSGSRLPLSSKTTNNAFKTVSLHSGALPVGLCVGPGVGIVYLVWLSGPPLVFHCLPQIRSQAQDPVSSPPSWALVAQTCPRPGGPPPGSCSGTRDCYKDKKTHKMCYDLPLYSSCQCLNPSSF